MDNNGWIGQFAVKVMNDKRQAGQLDFNPSTDKLTNKEIWRWQSMQNNIALPASWLCISTNL